MENYKQELEQLKKESFDLTHRINIAISKIDTPQYTVGKWYKCEDNKSLYCVVEFNGMYNDGKNYGFDFNGEWMELDVRTFDEIDIEAIKSEVEEALTKEAIKRGLVVGNYAIFGKAKDKRKMFGEYRIVDNKFCLGIDILMKDGIWAELYNPKSIDEWAKEFTCLYYTKLNGCSYKDIENAFKNFITENNFKLPE